MKILFLGLILNVVLAIINTLCVYFVLSRSGELHDTPAAEEKSPQAILTEIATLQQEMTDIKQKAAALFSRWPYDGTGVSA
jgi:hypothetical protein